MFSNKNNTSMEKSTQQNVLASGAEIIGDINAKGPFRIDGIIKGNVNADGKVVIGKKGEIHGSLQAENADFEGALKGKLNVTGTLTLRGTANIEGDVQVAKLIVEQGAIFNATCSMSTGDKPITLQQNQKR